MTTENTTIVVLFEKKGAEQMRAYVFQSAVTGKFHAILRDDEAEQTVTGVWCPTLEMATGYVNRWIK